MKNTHLSIFALGVIAILLFINQATQPQPTMPQPTPSPEPLTSNQQGTPMDVDQLIIEDIATGSGQQAKAGDTVVMHYTGSLLDGTKFDSSVDRGQHVETQIGVGQVIQGWDQGVPGMKVGGKRILTIPSALGYGATGAGGVIPPNAGLVFEVELLEIK
jgi:FKBP-type peptidyl-prolyl cis-trans isomerase FkpA